MHKSMVYLKEIIQSKLTSNSTSLSILMCRVKIACEREDWTFILVLAVVRDKAPALRQFRA